MIWMRANVEFLSVLLFLVFQQPPLGYLIS